MLLFKKLYRTLFKYKSQFISMILMITLGVGVFVGMNAEWKSLKTDSDRYYDETNYSDYWLYSENAEGFSREDIESVKSVKGVNMAQRRLTVDTVIDGLEKTVSLNVYDEYLVSKNHLVSGEDYDEDKDGVWLNDKFADLNNISLGDIITLKYSTYSIEAKFL